VTTSLETPPLSHRTLYHRRALGLLPARETPDWLERLMEEFTAQECSVALDMSGGPWDLVVFHRGHALRLVWCDQVLFDPLMVIQVIHPDRPGSPAERSVLRKLAQSRGAAAFVATFQPSRPLRDRWILERA